MDVTKTVSENLSDPIPDPLKPHTPMHAHHHMKVGAVNVGHGMSSGSESGSNSGDGEGESDVSDMVIDNSSKFAALSKKRRKSGESDYVPHEDSRSPESQSESESDSHSEQSEEESDTSAESRGLAPKPPASTLVRRLSDESDRSSSSSRLTPQQKQPSSTGLRMSPLIKRGSHSPFMKSNTRNILNDVSMRKYNYELCPPKRRAALNAKYTFDDENDSDDVNVRPGYQQNRVRRRRSPSGSEYEASDRSSAESSGEDSFVVEDESDDDYRPTKRSGRSGRGGRRGRVRNECSISLHESSEGLSIPKPRRIPPRASSGTENCTRQSHKLGMVGGLARNGYVARALFIYTYEDKLLCLGIHVQARYMCIW